MEDHDEIAELMTEPPGGENHGFSYVGSLDAGERTRQPLNSGDMQLSEFLASRGWSAERALAHRGVLFPGEYVDPFLLREAVCAELGFTYDQVRSVYRQGPLSAEQRELRGQIDASLLALSREGGNMWQLAKALGFERNTIRKAIRRAEDS